MTVLVKSSMLRSTAASRVVTRLKSSVNSRTVPATLRVASNSTELGVGTVAVLVMTVTCGAIAGRCSLAPFWLENSARSSAAVAAEIQDTSRQSFDMAESVCGGDVRLVVAHRPHRREVISRCESTLENSRFLCFPFIAGWMKSLPARRCGLRQRALVIHDPLGYDVFPRTFMTE